MLTDTSRSVPSVNLEDGSLCVRKEVSTEPELLVSASNVAVGTGNIVALGNCVDVTESLRLAGGSGRHLFSLLLPLFIKEYYYMCSFCLLLHAIF